MGDAGKFFGKFFVQFLKFLANLFWSIIPWQLTLVLGVLVLIALVVGRLGRRKGGNLPAGGEQLAAEPPSTDTDRGAETADQARAAAKTNQADRQQPHRHRRARRG